jgi:hypothetical protein
MSQYIQNLITTKGWKEIEGMINESISSCNQPIDEKLPSKEYKIVHLGNQKAADVIQKLLNKIKLAGGTFHEKKEPYI